ncbi:hypothetical protein [Streptomyces flaveolus]|uniref:hypothetical protein n=1 Tax=Streptomyces flaveolus TaxID=67297 RepID=UPI003322046D
MTHQLAWLTLVGPVNSPLPYALYLLFVRFLPYAVAFVRAFAPTVTSFVTNALC